MAPRALGALLAIVAAIAFVVSIASSAWWAGHPTVQGRERATQHVKVGLTGATGCNTGGDGSCAHIDTGGKLAAVGYLELAVLVVGVVLAFLVAVSSWQLGDRRKQLGSAGRGVAIAGAVGAVLVLALGPDIKATQQVSVPIGWGTFVTALGIGALAVASSIARKLEPGAPRAAVAPNAGPPDPHAMFGAPNQMFGAPSARPLYEGGTTPSPLDVGQPVALSTLLGNGVAGAPNAPHAGGGSGPYAGAPPSGGAYPGAPNNPYPGVPSHAYPGAPNHAYPGAPNGPYAAGGSGPYPGAPSDPYGGAAGAPPYGAGAQQGTPPASSPSATPPLGPDSSIGSPSGRPATIPPPLGPYSSVGAAAARPNSPSVPPPMGSSARPGSQSVPPPIGGAQSPMGAASSMNRAGSQSVPPPMGPSARPGSPSVPPPVGAPRAGSQSVPPPIGRAQSPLGAAPSMNRAGSQSVPPPLGAAPSMNRAGSQSVPPPLGSSARPGSQSVPPPVGAPRAGSQSVPPPMGAIPSTGRAGSQSVPPPVGSIPSMGRAGSPSAPPPIAARPGVPPMGAIPSMNRPGAPSSRAGGAGSPSEIDPLEGPTIADPNANPRARIKTPSIPGAPITTPAAFDDTQLAATPFGRHAPKPRPRTTPGPGTDPMARPLPGLGRVATEPQPPQRASAPTLSHSVPPPPAADGPIPPPLPPARDSAENVTAIEVDAEAKAAAKARDARAMTAQPAHEPTHIGGIDPRMPASLGDATSTGLSVGGGHGVEETSPTTDLIDVPEVPGGEGGEEDTSVSAMPTAPPSAAASLSTAPESLPPPSPTEEMASGPTPACPQCESPMAWVEEHLRFYCKSCRMYF